MEDSPGVAEDVGQGRGRGGRYRGGGRGNRGGRGRRLDEEGIPYEEGGQQGELDEGGLPPTLVTNRVYVNNLSWHTTWQALKDHMRQAGEVVYADVFLDEKGRSKGCGIVEFRTAEEALQAINTLNETKLGGREIYIREDREDKNLKKIQGGGGGSSGGGSSGGGPGGGQYYRGGGGGGGNDNGNGNGNGNGGGNNSDPGGNGSRSPYGRKAPSQPDLKGRQIFVGNLPFSTSWQDLKDAFRQCGNIIRADVLLGVDGRSKGQGTVLFESKADSQRAIAKFNGVDFQGRIITVHEDKFV